jgi:hypothetical protein
MGGCFSKSKIKKKLNEQLLTLDEIYEPGEPIISTEEYYHIIGTARLIRKKYDLNKKSSDVRPDF